MQPYNPVLYRIFGPYTEQTFNPFWSFLYLLQTSGMLGITLMVILAFYFSQCTCVYLEDTRRTYQMLSDVEHILQADEAEKEKAEEKQKFLSALEHNGEYKGRRLPPYMLNKECVIVAKLNPPPAAHH